MSARFSNISGCIQGLKNHLRAFEQQCVEETRKAVRTLHAELLNKTPVWSGETVRNYVWGVNRKPAGESRAAIPTPPNPGPTNSMPLGPEPRRSANESASTREMLSVIMGQKRLINFVVTNLIDSKKWDLIENGNAPTPERSRIPGGLSMLAMQSAKSFLPYFK